ncbi:MAG: hypothetical protein R3F37_16920 [Candidatus Competibacteraceae bacterium]
MQTVLVVTLAFLACRNYWPASLGTRYSFKSPLRRFLKASLSVVSESLFSVLLAPVLMLFQAKFVILIVLRRAIGWPLNNGTIIKPGFKEACHAHAGQTVLGTVAGYGPIIVPDFFWWFIPVLLGMILAIPLSIYSSSVAWGRASQRWGLFLTPQKPNRRAC